MENLIWKYMESNVFQEFLVHSFLVVIKHLEDLERKKLNLPIFNKIDSSVKEDLNQQEENEILISQKLSLIVEFLKIIMEMRNLELNDLFEPYLVNLFLKIKLQMKRESKGILKLLSILGDPNELIALNKTKLLTDNVDYIYEDEESLIKPVKNGRNLNKEFNELVEENNDYKSPANNRKGNKVKSKTEAKNTRFNKKIKGDKADLKNLSGERIYTEEFNNEELNFMQKFGLSLKAKKDIKELKDIQIGRPTIRALKELEHIKFKNSDKIKTVQEEKDKRNESSNEIKKKNMVKPYKKQFVKQKSEKNKLSSSGVQPITKNVINNINNTVHIYSKNPLLYPFNYAKLKKDLNNLDFEVFDLSQCENRDIYSTDLIKFKKKPLFKYLFFSYSNATNEKIKQHSFRFAEKKSFSIADAWKMLKDFELSIFVTKKENEMIFKKLNTDVRKEAPTKPLDFENFLLYFMHLSLFVFTKPPLDLNFLTLGHLMEKMIKIMKTAGTKIKQAIKYFQEDKMDQNQSEKIREIQINLQNDPNYEIPEVFNLFYK